MMKSCAFPAEGNQFGYMIYFPENYDETEKYPLMVFLHGAGERGNGVEELPVVENAGLTHQLKCNVLSLPCIVLAPQCPAEQTWNQRIYDVLALIEKIMNSYPIDRTRVTATGLSMGGFGTWELGMTRPELFAALAPICGGGTAWRAENLRGKKIWTFHGNCDSIVNISNTVDMVNRARDAGADVRFTIFDGVDHYSWDIAYLDTRVLGWLLEQHL